ncbi:unnamed protein product [Thlaspi arvense]|uniref:Uncharacterized protein n=1 Tax=Thlaspi arvense TaxID=13288 RepID=A0AAU9T7Q7_THLAR|nr:unnamed protein product [Thlaspi arvense]
MPSPTILQEQKSLSSEFSIFTTTLADIDEEENPAILQRMNEELKKTRRGGSTKTPIDFALTVSQTLTRSDLVDIFNQELKVLRSEMENKVQTSDRFVPRGRSSDCVEEGKVEEPHEEVKYLADEVLEWISRGDLESDISTEDSVCKPEDGGDNLEKFDENEQVNNAEEGGGIDEVIEELLEKIEEDGSYLERIKDDYDFGDFLEGFVRNILREKAEEEEKVISSWITNGEPEVETGVAEEKKEERRDTKKKSPVKVTLERSVQEPSVTKRDCSGYARRLYLIEKLKERDENLKKRRGKAVSCGAEFSFLVAEYMFLIPNELLAIEIEDFWICLRRFGVNEDDDKGTTSVVMRKLEKVFEVVIRKKENKEHHSVDLPESVRFDDYIPLCVDAIQILGKIVCALRRNKSERLEVSYVDSLFVDFEKVLMKIELRLAEMKQRLYRSVSADYESFSKSERFDGFLRRKLMKRVNADSRFGRSVIGSYLAEIWSSLFETEALQEQSKAE